MTTLLADSPISYYQQLYAILRKQILEGAWQPGERVPSEAELIASYGVSRITVRQAYDLLVNEGLVFRRRGSGTFVNVTPIEQGLIRLTSFTEDMQRRGIKPETRVLATRLEPASAEIAHKLGIEAGSELAVLERLRLADGVPIGVERSHLIHRDCPGILSGDYAAESLHTTLFDRFGIRLVRAHQAIRAIPAGRALAAQLGVRAGSPLLYTEQVTFRQTGAPVEFLQMSYCGDRYVLFSELRS